MACSLSYLCSKQTRVGFSWEINVSQNMLHKFGRKTLQVVQASKKTSLGRGGGTLVLICHYSATASKMKDIKLTLIDHLTCIYNTWRFPCEPITGLVSKWCIYISKVLRTADGEFCG